ncbi:hypothetical protein FKW77_010691 [Venturia effusa]|uniref:C3H1-type domain-containing protein n=1 Tax=Venturia effusa TaxID=50376 RepID=A0A517KY62_9PEZI|nr:hypothetical protein FKW77_010691 [Venturia effusa]
MAQNPRDQSLQNGMFDNANDGFNYNNFYSHGQGYGANLTADSDLSDPHSQYNTAAYQHTPAWQHPVASTSYASPHQNPSAFVNPSARSYFAVTPPTSSSTPFQNNNPYASHGLQQQQYSHSLDPSMVTSVGEHGRSFGQTMPMYSSAAPSTTIAPAALHANAYLNGNRPVQTPPTQLSNQFQQPGTVSTMLKPPKAVTEGEFKMTPLQELLKATNSVKLHHYAALGRIPVDLPINKATIPQYIPRKSQNELLLMSGADPSLKAKIAKRTKKIHVPKYRPNIAGQSPVSVSSESDSSDYDSDSDYDSEPEPEKFPLPGDRPQDAIGATRYDSAKAVFLPRNVYVENEALRLGLKNFWNLIKTIRERWNKDSEAVKEAADAKKDSELPMLRDRVKNQRDMMKVALDTAIEFGHQDLIRASGTAKPFMMTIKSFLLERNREDDHDGPFTKTLFKYLSMSTGLNNEIVEELGLNKIFTRFSKRGDAEVKALVTKINENVVAESKKKKENEPVSTGSPKPVKNDTKVELVAGVKRPRPADGATTAQPAKRISSGPVAHNGKDSAAAKLGLLKRPGSVTGDKTSTATAATKPKSIAKPSTNFFSSLQSASKKPGTALNANSTAKAKLNLNGAAEKKAAVAPAAPMKSGFSFAETMANLAKAREPEVIKKPDDPKRPPETAEQKAKRLRKEERRKLRVTWKPEGMLVEIREFSRDPSEMNNNNARDVRDGKEKEGLMFKQHMEMMDVDVDEEDDQPMEQTFFDFKEPSPIDFTRISQDDRGRNYDPFGGGLLKPESPERQIQESREATTLMAFYAFKSDIPPCPREPADPYTGENVETKPFGEPDDATIVRRLARFQQPVPSAPAFDINAILQQLAPQTQPAPLPVSDQNLSAIQNLLQQTSNPYQPAPAQLQNYAPAPAPQPPPPEAQPPNPLFDILASLNGHVQSQAQPPAPQQYAPPPAAPPQLDLSTLLASLQQGQLNPQTMQSFGVPLASNTPELYVDPERKRMLEQGYEAERNGNLDYSSDGNRSNKRQKTKNNTNNNNPGNPEKKFLYPCRFFKEGKCKKGANCTFRHD